MGNVKEKDDNMLVIDNARERALIRTTNPNPPSLEGIIALKGAGRFSGREISTRTPEPSIYVRAR
jgi:hypothetical protein